MSFIWFLTSSSVFSRDVDGGNKAYKGRANGVSPSCIGYTLYTCNEPQAINGRGGGNSQSAASVRIEGKRRCVTWRKVKESRGREGPATVDVTIDVGIDARSVDYTTNGVCEELVFVLSDLSIVSHSNHFKILRIIRLNVFSGRSSTFPPTRAKAFFEMQRAHKPTPHE